MSTVVSGLVTAEWRDLVVVSYEIDPLLLVAYVPRGTSLDFHDGRALVSVVGLRMLETRLAGVPVPFHQDFPQVNFRFYVWRREGHEVRRGVVFIKEIVPSVALTVGARLLFNERYTTAPMRHEVVHAEQGWAAYEWQIADRWNRVSAKQRGKPRPAAPQSVEGFVKDRGWGYSRQSDGSTMEYRLEHPSWDICSVVDPLLDCDVAGVFGPQFKTTLARPPVSAFIAPGSRAVVHVGRALD